MCFAVTVSVVSVVTDQLESGGSVPHSSNSSFPSLQVTLYCQPDIFLQVVLFTHYNQAISLMISTAEQEPQ